ncbi:phage tail protein [Secundilactobacillus kimchicus]|uniref:phage tail protein n=1 Tax=Secundilactobacillus kimchicus TaxID=528209 RepID=UPI001C02E0CC|nr:phage tail protein [Secundilactobacillus kimchicus]MBT9670684.1 phage tail protein [Secundilactobacillus kimchicus]
MANKIENETSFDKLLDDLAKGTSTAQRLAANGAGAKVFIEMLKPKIPERTHFKESAHLRDSLIINEKPNGGVVIGFAKRGGKGYVGRLLNDGWQPVGPYGRNRGASGERVQGLHFWEYTQKEAKGVVSRAIYETLRGVTK